MKRYLVTSILILTCMIAPKESAADNYHPRYKIDATIDMDNKQVVARQDLRFGNNSSSEVREIYFHIYPNRTYTKKERNLFTRFAGYFKVDPFPEGFDTGTMSIQNISSSDIPLEYSIEGKDDTILKVVLHKPLPPGGVVGLQIDFTVDIPHMYGRLGWHDNIVKLSRWYPILSVLDDEGWHNYPFYPFHRPFYSEASFYNVNVTIAQDQEVIHSGVLNKRTNNPDGSKTLFIETDHPVREFSLAMSPDYQVMVGEFNGTLIKSFYLPGDEYHAQKAWESARDMMQFCTARFKKYPYKEFSIAPVHLGYGGEQMSNMVFVDTRVYQLPKALMRYFDFLIAHETGHQWFYNIVGINEAQEMWLEEGIDSYFLMEYLDEKYGEDAEIVEFPEWFKDWEWMLPKLTFRGTRGFRYKMITRIGYDHPIISDLASFQEPSTIFSIAYGKGTYVVSMLKDQMGVEAFDRTFERIFEEYKYKNLRLDDFMRIAEEESGKDLSSFFEQWLFTDGQMNYAVSRTGKNKVVFENKGDIEMPVQGLAKFKGGTAYVLYYDGKEKRKVHDTGVHDTIVSIELDQHNRFLDIDRTNNYWPRKLNIQPVPVYLGLYDLPIFLPEDSYNLVFGPDFSSNGIGVKASLQKPYEHNFYVGTSYEAGADLHHSRVGYQMNNLFETQTAAGFEILNRTDLDNGDEDLVSGKVFLRRELWPVQYGLGDVNDHVSLYVLRNHALENTLNFGGREDIRNTSYVGIDEAIVGSTFHFNRAGPYPDPREGYGVDTLLENAGHFLGGTQTFSRASIDGKYFLPATQTTTVALRLKYGWGYPNDKSLYQLGGWDGLRGFDRKEIRGSNAFIGSLEYRFPLKRNLDIKFLDNLFGIESIGGVVFFDAGQAWFSEFQESTLKRNAGAGLRVTVNIGSYLEKVILRLDVGQAIDAEEEDDPQIWFGLNHAF